MSDAKDSGKAAFEEASTRLDEGLKTCRAVVENYRSMLTFDQQSSRQSDGPAIALDRAAREAHSYGQLLLSSLRLSVRVSV